MTRIPKASTIGSKSRQSLLPAESKQEKLTKFHEGKIIFSFHHLDKEHEAFNCGGTDASWFLHLFDNLKEISKLSRDEFVVQQRNHYDVHAHN